MIKYLLILIILFTITSHSQKSDFENVVYNVGLGSFGSAIGAVINKKENEKSGKVFLKGLWQGSIGGALIYGSKKIVSEIPKTKHIEYNWGAKLVNAAGVSIIENAARNRDFWELWHFNLGFNRFEFNTKDKFKFTYKIRPISLALTLGSAINRKAEWSLMLQSGEVIFSASKLRHNENAEAYALGQAVVLKDNSIFSIEQVLAHEFIHIYQYNDYNFINSYFTNTISDFRNKSSLINTLSNYIYWDLHYPIVAGLYEIERRSNTSNSDNFFEREARFYSPDELNSIFNY
ncbi:hypothetical protein [Dokdonia sp. Hel_I_53]|uniref:hypothetical protein n=1 Tax=Dokdonia sp. Hel_I_53 TaxID=1566287 RepID=UPI0011996362|nr:hypothetical protein [Dokdonia sp. Hel_I_53]TVZ52610.1 hypothetical protein OD90_1788 [Dokdonia sp. Hel_I_53]